MTLYRLLDLTISIKEKQYKESWIKVKFKSYIKVKFVSKEI